jgi:hypothetical protein
MKITKKILSETGRHLFFITLSIGLIKAFETIASLFLNRTFGFIVSTFLYIIALIYYLCMWIRNASD